MQVSKRVTNVLFCMCLMLLTALGARDTFVCTSTRTSITAHHHDSVYRTVFTVYASVYRCPEDASNCVALTYETSTLASACPPTPTCRR
jgi:hypothetical protein